MFKFYLDNTLVSNPVNWSDFTETIERDDNINGILPKYDVKLNFNSDGYKYIYDTKQISGFCQLINLRVDQKCGGGYETILNGYIFLSDCKFNLNKCIVECSVEDNNYGARIFNNKSIQIYLDSSLSKNNVSIAPSPTYPVTFFKPSTGVDVVTKRKVYSVWDSFKYLINFISDGQIDFESNYLNKALTTTGNPQRRLSITTGGILRNAGTLISPKISFQDLFSNVDKKYPIGFTVVQQSNGRPLIKIEERGYFYGNSSGVVISNIQDLKQSTNNELLYSEISIGGETATYDAAIHSIPSDTRMFFSNESYYFSTECNIDKKLDLVTSYICDSNIIEELVDTNTTNSSYDESVFFVEVNYSGGIAGHTAIKASLLTSSVTPYYYNFNLKNENVSQRFNIYADLIQFINSNDIGFEASKNANYNFPYHDLADYTYGLGGIINPLTEPIVKIDYQDDSTSPNHDTGNNYTLTSRYTAPNNGYYYFSVNLPMYVETGLFGGPFGVTPLNPNIMIIFNLYIRKYSAANVLIETYTKQIGPAEFLGYKVFTSNTTFSITGDKNFFLEAGDYVETYFNWTSVPYQTYDAFGIYNGAPTKARVVILSGAIFKTITTASNGTLAIGNSLDYNVERLEFDRPLSKSQYDTLKLDLSKSLTVNHDGQQNKISWIRKTVRTLETGEMKWELISNINNS